MNRSEDEDDAATGLRHIRRPWKGRFMVAMQVFRTVEMRNELSSRPGLTQPFQGSGECTASNPRVAHCSSAGLMDAIPSGLGANGEDEGKWQKDGW
jgi:hypothetical protein